MDSNLNLYYTLFVSILLSILFFKKIKYDFFSIKGIVIVYFFIFYPLVILIKLAESFYFYEGIVKELDITLDTLYSYSILILIFYIVELFKFRKSNINNRPSVYFNINRAYLLILFFLFALILRLSLGLYYHVSINPEYNLAAGSFQNLIDKLHWIGLLPAFLLLYKYHITNKKKYLYLSFLLVIIFVSIYIPSGSRTTAFSFVPIYLIYMFNNMKSLKRVMLLGFISAIILSILIVLSGKLRVNGSNFEDKGVQEDIAVLTHRLSDSLTTGRIMEIVPSEYEYRNFKKIDSLLYTPFPHFVRVLIGVEEVNFNDGPAYAYEIGLTPSWTSIPITILGDFYSRFSWYGVILLSTMLAIILRLFDSFLEKKSDIFKLIFLVLFSRYISQIYVVDLQILFVTLTREFIVTYIVSIGILYLIKKRGLAHLS
jgi:hypothetical protein